MTDFLLLETGDFLLQENGSDIELDEIPSVSNVTCAASALDNNILTTGKTKIPTLPYINVQWTGTSMGAAFAYYEVTRLDDDGGNVVARITNEAATYFADFEAKRGVETTYFMRAVHVGGTASDYVFAGQSVTLEAYDDCSVYLVANAAPFKSVALYDTTPITFTRSNAPDVTRTPIEGRDAPYGFIDAERSGDIFTRTFLLAFDDPAIDNGALAPGREMFNPLLALIEDPDIPSVTVLDAHGNRWYTVAQPGNLVWLEPAGSYKADVTFYETALSNNAPILVTAFPYQGTGSPAVDPPPPPPPPEFVVPSSVDPTGATDVTAGLQAAIDATPDGKTLTVPPGAIYRCEFTVNITNRNNFTLDLTGGQIIRKNVMYHGPMSAVAAASNNAPYAGAAVTIANATSFGTSGQFIHVEASTGIVRLFKHTGRSGNTLTGLTIADGDSTGSFHTGDVVGVPDGVDRVNAHLAITGGSNITVFGGIIIGANPNAGHDGPYVANLEAQHAIQTLGVNGFEIYSMTYGHIFGDFRYMAQSNGQNKNGVDRNCLGFGNGRQAITMIGIDGYKAHDNNFQGIRRSTLDMEVFTNPDSAVNNVEIYNNIFGAQRLSFLSANNAFGESPITNISIHDNHSAGVLSGGFGRDASRRANFSMVNNVFDGRFGTGNGGHAAFTIKNTDGVTVTGNVIPLDGVGGTDKREMFAVSTFACTSVSVSGNTLTPGSNTLQNAILAEGSLTTTGIAGVSGTTAWFVQLHTGDPGAAGTANVCLEGRRIPVSFTLDASMVSGGGKDGYSVEWSNALGNAYLTGMGHNETATWVSVWDAASGGTFKFKAQLTNGASITGTSWLAGQTVQIVQRQLGFYVA